MKITDLPAEDMIEAAFKILWLAGKKARVGHAGILRQLKRRFLAEIESEQIEQAAQSVVL